MEPQDQQQQQLNHAAALPTQHDPSAQHDPNVQQDPNAQPDPGAMAAAAQEQQHEPQQQQQYHDGGHEHDPGADLAIAALNLLNVLHTVPHIDAATQRLGPVHRQWQLLHV
jgi:hypothetical protein